VSAHQNFLPGGVIQSKIEAQVAMSLPKEKEAHFSRSISAQRCKTKARHRRSAKSPTADVKDCLLVFANCEQRDVGFCSMLLILFSFTCASWGILFLFAEMSDVGKSRTQWRRKKHFERTIFSVER